ncbi:MAG TPA: OstA-like protein [Prolixibacteraceae bacterium]|nr:OstA-like protein [Prolixibacteraceae bacterium]
MTKKGKITQIYSRLVLPGLFCFLAFSGNILAQSKKKVDILNADLMNHNEQIVANAQRLLGHVNITVDGALMWCDSMYSYTNNTVDAFGNVHIIRGDTLNMYADFIHYDPGTKLAKARRNVRLIDKKVTLTTDSLDYSMVNDLASYNYSGTVKDSTNVLTSLIGQYYVNDKKAFFKTNVDGLTKDYKIRSETLIYFTETKKVYIEGPTLIYNDKDTLYAEYGWYDSMKGFARLTKNPRIWNGKQKVKADSIFYDKVNGEGLAMGHARIQDIENSIIVLGNRVQYNDLTKMASASDMAVLIQYSETDTLYLHADRLITMPDSTKFNRALADKMKINTSSSDSLPGWALGKNTFLNDMLAADTLEIHTMITDKLISELLATDTTNTSRLVRDQLEKKTVSSIKQNPDSLAAASTISGKTTGSAVTDTLNSGVQNPDSLAHYTMNNGKLITDTLATDNLDPGKMAADTLAADTTKNSRLVLAWNKVRFFRKDFQGKCDSLVYLSNDSTIQMYTDPVIWSDNNQISANYIEMINRSRDPDEVRMKEDAFIIAMEDDSLRFNQIKGKDMTGFIRNNSLYKIFVDGNGQSNYYARDQNGIIGLNNAVSSKINISLSEGKVKRITFIKSPEGEVKPMAELEEGDKLLPGFNWQKELRPKNKEDIFRIPVPTVISEPLPISKDLPLPKKKKKSEPEHQPPRKLE